MSKNNSERLTGLYSLSKTLRFELKPEPATKERFDKWLREIEEKTKDTDNETFVEYDKINMFGKDIKIANAYKVLKIVLDKLHEIKIEKSLSSDIAKEIDFSSYYESYKAKTLEAKTEEKLRKEIGETFKEGDKYFLEEIGKKSTFNKKILDYILKDIESEKPMNIYPENISKEEVKEHIKSFQGFFTYLDGYNTNRSNYYEVEKEQSTAIATRIVHENLPKFCDNIIRFEKKKNDYVAIYSWLKEQGKETILKNEEGEEVEAMPIKEDVFVIKHFNNCLTQKEIEDYNQIIGNYNLLINLYNQNRRGEKEFKKLDEFETLYKQIGCGKRKSFITLLQKDKENELDSKERNSNDIYSVEKLLKTAFEAGKKVFKESENDYTVTLPKFIAFLKDRTKSGDWEGLYWNKKAVENISGRYFANWHTIKDLLKNEKTCTSKSKAKDEDPIQLLDAVELSALFRILDSDELGVEYVFKKYLIEEEKVNVELPVSVNLINLLCAEIEDETRMFLEKANDVINLKCYKDSNVRDGEDDENVNQVDKWFKYATNSMRIVRYFSVRKNKIKGSLPDTEMENMLDSLLHNDEYDWFGWYNLLRNYLTKKPQDDVKENMLKLNFAIPTLLNGWSDEEEKNKHAVLLKKCDVLYLCILAKKVVGKVQSELLEYNYIFDTSNENNSMYIEESEAGRLIMRNLSFRTLSGKGFKSKYGEKYGDMSKREPQKAIECLQNYIAEKYVSKYPSLQKCLNKKYADSKQFYNHVYKLLDDCYYCDFTPIDWNLVLDKEQKGELFLFKIDCKDYKKAAFGKRDLQTMYWEDVLSETSKHQLSAGSKIFKRDPIQFPIISHKVGERLVNKKDINGRNIPNHIYHEIFDYANNRKRLDEISKEAKDYIIKKQAIIKDVKHEIIKDRRFYGNEKYMFHCAIKLFYESKEYKKIEAALSPVNEEINNVFLNIDDICFVGIDRGEKHLVYSCIIDNNGRIIKDGRKHYDVINGTNYVEKLEERAEERDKARKSCQRMAKISDLKDGYISHVVHGLTNTIIKDKDGNINPHAYIVLEDLSRGMKDGRQKIEKQVYQKLETALAKKLNFVVDKDAKNGEIGSVSKALQLTPPFGTYQDIEGKKQFGVMLYTRANYTSVTDPATGWRKTIYLKDGKKEVIKEQIMDKFTDFGFDGKDYYFTYKENNVGKEWKMYSGKDGNNLPRFQNKKSTQTDYGKWIPEQVDIVGMLNKIFEGFDKTKSFRKQIEEDGLEINETAWQSLRYVINVIQQIRNSGDSKENDNFLYSPVRNEKGEHFDTRNYENNGDLAQIVDADANGAYNIARKGLIMYEHIKYAKNEGKEPDLFISDKEWDMWLLNRVEWKKHLSEFALRKESKSRK